MPAPKDRLPAELEADLASIESNYLCTLTPGAPSPVIPAVFGHNQINGPILPLPFSNGILMNASAAMWSGQQRYPGGTVANYWWWPTASFVEPSKGMAQPLPGSYAAEARAEGREEGEDAPGDNEYGVWKHKGPLDYDYSKWQEVVSALPARSFSLKAFNKHFGSASPVTSPLGHMYDLNVVTATAEQVMEQLDVLKATSEECGFPVRCIEFGNECFMTNKNHYKPWFVNAHDYITKVTPGLQHARKLFPDAKLAVPCGMRFSGGKDGDFAEWNEALVDYAHLFDAVTVHEYTCSRKSVDIDKYKPKHRRSVVAAWGDVALTKACEWAERFFGGKEIWVTEWGYASWTGVPLQGLIDGYAEMLDHAVTGIYYASYLLKAVELSQRESCPVTAMNRHVFNDVRDIGWGRDTGLVHFSKKEDGGWSAEINGPGQIFSHIAYIATAECDQWLPVTVEGGGILRVGADLEGERSVASIQAAAFANSRAVDQPPIYIVINRADRPIKVRLPTSAGSKHERLVRTITYSHKDEPQYEGRSMPLWKLNGHFEHPWSEGPFAPAISTTPLSEGEPWAVVDMGPISLTIIYVLPSDGA